MRKEKQDLANISDKIRNKRVVHKKGICREKTKLVYLIKGG